MISRRHEECDELSTLDLEDEVTDEQRTLHLEHVEKCEDCRIELAIFEELSTQDSGALETLEGADRQRFIEDIVDRADMPNVAQQEIPDRNPLWNPLSLLSGAAFGAAATAALFLLLSLPTEQGDQLPDDRNQDIVAQSSADPDEARLILSTGQVRAGHGEVEIGAVAPIGRELQVDGQAVLELAPGLLVIFENQTRFNLGTGDSEVSSPEIELHSGGLLASITPEQEGSTGLSIVTQRGRVDITGTVVDIKQNEDDFEVSVLRGVVETQTSGSSSTVTAGEALTLGTNDRRHLGDEETETLWERTRRLSMFTATDGAAVTLRTDPPTSEVLVDEVMIGLTPLRVSLRPGHHQVAFRVNDRVVARTVLDLSPNEVVSRSFQLDLSEETAEIDAGPERQVDSPPLGAGAGEQSPSVEEILARAQTYRAQREFSQAASAYRELLRLHPNAAESRASLVSLGHIELERLGHPAQALRLYDRYLGGQSSGSLAQEALWGKIRALRALGRTSQERQALELFLQRFPGALQERSVRRRLEEL